jgi:hypothetical protein
MRVHWVAVPKAMRARRANRAPTSRSRGCGRARTWRGSGARAGCDSQCRRTPRLSLRPRLVWLLRERERGGGETKREREREDRLWRSPHRTGSRHLHPHYHIDVAWQEQTCHRGISVKTQPHAASRCGSCATALSVTLRPSMVHEASATLGWLDTVNCTAVVRTTSTT